MRACRKPGGKHTGAAGIEADRGAHAGAVFNGGDDPADLLVLERRCGAGTGAFSADVNDRRARFEHGGGVGAARFDGVVLPAVRKAIGCDVEDAHDLGLIQPDGATAQLEGRVDFGEVGPLRHRILRKSA